MKKCKKMRVIVLTVLLILIILSVFTIFIKNKEVEKIASIEEKKKYATTSADGMWKYQTFSGGGIEIIEYIDDTFYREDLSIIVPETIDGYTVKSIESSLGIDVFPERTSQIELPLTIVNIGYRAFAGTNITEITGLKNLTTIGEEAFAECGNLKYINDFDSVTYIGKNAFQGCANLKFINSLENVVTIKEYAFVGCERLEFINSLENVVTIEYNAFQSCEKLENIGELKNIKTIGDNAFQGCVHLDNIGDLSTAIRIGYSAFGYSGISNKLNLSKDAVIYSFAFENTMLTSVSINCNITSDRVFYLCKYLKDIEILSHVSYIPDNCYGLIPDDITTIHCDFNSNAYKFAKSHGYNYEVKDLDIQVKTKPNKTTYIQNYENLDLTGGVLNLVCTNSSNSLSMTADGVQVTGFDNTTIGEKTITVSYEGKTTTFTVNVVSKSLSGIEVKTKPNKTTYIQNAESLDLTGGELTLKYNDNTTETLSMTAGGIEVTGFDNTTIGEKTITVSYEGKTTTFNIYVISKVIYEETTDGSGITIKGTEDSSIVIIPDNINGKPVTEIGEGAFKDRTDINTIYIPSSITKIAEDAFEGCDEITIECESGSKAEEFAKEHDMNYELIDKTIASISIKQLPNKVVYTSEDAKLDLTGGRLLLTYTDNTTSPISIKKTGVEVTGFDNTSEGKQKILVTYKNKETTFNIEVKNDADLLGDINQDGEVNATDLLLIKRHIIAVNKTQWLLTGNKFEAGDMNLDNKINATDLLLLKRKIVNK